MGEHRRVGAKDNITEYVVTAWTAFLAFILCFGELMAVQVIWGEERPNDLLIYLTGAGSVVSGAVAHLLAKKHKAGWAFLAVPWFITQVSVGYTGHWAGMKAWGNQIILGWNRMQEDGLTLFRTEVSEQNVVAFTLMAAVLLGEVSYFLAAERQLLLIGILGMFWILVMMVGNAFSSLVCAVLVCALLGIWMAGGRVRAIRLSMRWTIGVMAVAALMGYLLSNDRLSAMDDFRENTKELVHNVRYGEETLPEGDLEKSGLLNQEKGTLFTVASQQQKNLYLRAYVGGRYVDNTWKALASAAYSGENNGMLKWLSKQGFDPLTQVADYYRLCEESDQPQTNTLTVTMEKGSRFYAYVPASLKGLVKGHAVEKKDYGFLGGGLMGMRNYTLEEISGSRPSELLTAADWVSAPTTQAQEQYCEAESVYRNFVYENYTAVDASLYEVLEEYFWKDYETETESIYGAVDQIREKCRERNLDKEKLGTELSKDPICRFLSGEGGEDAMLYATVAVEALRARGIPARYAEGYYIRAGAYSREESVAVSGKNAHAWAEVYFDGMGWMPVDVMPGYYYDTVTLQEMVGSPDTVRKTAALQKGQDKAEVLMDENAGGMDAAEGSDGTGQKVVQVLLGLLAILTCVLTVGIVLAEILRTGILMVENKRYQKGDVEYRTKRGKDVFFLGLKLWGIEASLGFRRKEADEEAVSRIPNVRKGQVGRVFDLLEKNVYGGVRLENYEERTIRMLAVRLFEVEGAVPFRMRVKLHFAPILLAFAGKKGMAQ